MPHIVVLYTAHLEPDADLSRLCRRLADTLIAQRDEQGAVVFPVGGTRVFAVPSTHHAVADGGDADRAAGGSGELGFMYLNLRMARGRSDAVKRATGDALLAVVQDHLGPLFDTRRVGVTLQIDESPGQVYDGKAGNLRALFTKAD